jgi:hypothetical protein
VLKIKDLFRPRPWFPEIRRIGSKMAGSDGGANNLVQDFEESFQVGGVLFVHPWGWKGVELSGGPIILRRILKNHSR